MSKDINQSLIDHINDNGKSIQTMKVYRYGMQHRPMGLGCQPKGFILPYESYARTTLIQPDWKNPQTCYGYIEYPHKLSDDEVEQFELNYLGEFSITVSERFGSIYRHDRP